MNLTEGISIIISAFILDLLLGDPDWMPHPVRWIGRAIHLIERWLRKTGLPLKICGILLTLIIVSTTFTLASLVNRFAYMIDPLLGVIVSVIMLYSTFSVRSLYNESMKVYKALKENQLITARKNLSMIVGRDTECLDNREVIRGTVETIAENTVDGVIAPLFYAFLGGPSLAMAYKAINTLDSMVGYKNEQYIDLGWASARLDDLVNYIPACSAGFLMSVASLLCGKDWRKSFITVIRDRRNHPSPNSGIPEAAVAGALGVQLGGLNYYYGIPSIRPFIGQPGRDLCREHIRDANRIMIISSFLMLISGIILVRALWTFSL